MRAKMPTRPYPIDAPREKQDTIPFDLCRAKPALVRRSASTAVTTHAPPRRASFVEGHLPSVMVEDRAEPPAAMVRCRCGAWVEMATAVMRCPQCSAPIRVAIGARFTNARVAKTGT
jgi:hypothetical protein